MAGQHFGRHFPDSHLGRHFATGEEGDPQEQDSGIPEWPDIPIRQFRIDLKESKTISESLFTRKRQVVSLGGGTSDRWEGLITTPILNPSQVRVMMNWLVDVGLYGRFTLPHPDYDGPSTGLEDGTVKGGSQRGQSLTLDGLSTSVTVAHEGDWFQVGDELKRLTADATTNSGGEVTLSFKPAIRVSPSDNETVIFDTPVLLAELTTIPGEETDSLGMMAFTISFQEAFA